jgi:hypothetical protein
MAKNLINYEEVQEHLREIKKLTTNLSEASNIVVQKTKSILDSTNAPFFKNDILPACEKLAKADAECLDGIANVERAYMRYEEEHRALAGSL